MADTSDVETAIVNLVEAAVYPNGTSQPSILNAAIKVYRGWPVSATLDVDLAEGKSNVTVFPPPGMEKNTTRWPRSERRLTKPVHTLTVAVSGNQITIGGTVAVPQNVIAICGGQFVFPYGVQTNDTLASIAANLAELIAEQFPGTSSAGPVVTIAGQPGIVLANVSSVAQVWTEQSRQQKSYDITCWCPTPAARDQLAAAIDVALKQVDFILLADGSLGRFRYESTRTIDDPEKVGLYRRDLVYWVEYATAVITTAPETGAIGITSGPTGAGKVTYF